MKLNTSQPPTIRTLSSKSFTNLLYFDITSVSGKSVARTQKCYFRYYGCPDQLTFKKWSDFENLFYCRYLVPIWDGLCKIFFSSSIGTSDRYIQQIDRSMKTFYNFYNFHILGIVQFKLNSRVVLLRILPQNICLNRLISIEYENKWNIWLSQIYRVHATDELFGHFSKINFPNKWKSF